MTERPEMQSWLRNMICKAELGDVRAAHEVVRFMERELSGMAILGSLPTMAKLRVECLAREAERVSEFLYGYSEALPKKPKKKKRK
jgi:hypothetical protein